MRIVYRNIKGLKIADIWQPSSLWENEVRCDIASFHGKLKQEAGEKLTEQHTLLTNLHQTEDELKNNIRSKNFKYEIRRTEKDNLKFLFYDSKMLSSSAELLQKFCQCYREMYNEKNMQNELEMEVLNSYILANAMYLTVVIYENEPIVYHSYVDCGTSVRLWHSCSNFRSEQEIANLIGRANKRLHWEDWLYFKNREYAIYDWGGVFNYNSENGIDQFKQSFGGTPHDYYNGKVGVSLLGKIVLKLKK